MDFIYFLETLHTILQIFQRFWTTINRFSLLSEYRQPMKSSLYDKRDVFNFHITNFHSLSSNIRSPPTYGVFISQLIRYVRACSSYECFILRAARLSSKLLRQGYVRERLKSSLRNLYGRYRDLIKHYEVPLFQMLHDILRHLQWHP